MIAEHGTHAGYQEHTRNGGKACESCRDAARAYHAQWRRNNPEKYRQELARQRIRDRALRELGRRHVAEMRTLIERYSQEASI